MCCWTSSGSRRMRGADLRLRALGGGFYVSWGVFEWVLRRVQALFSSFLIFS